MNVIFQQKWGNLSYGIFHSKLILYEFDDRLRVIVPSANLYDFDWEYLSQVIWFQDFFPVKQKAKNKEEIKEEEPSKKKYKEEVKVEDLDNDFKQYLQFYLEKIVPRNVKVKEVYRKKIDLNKYDFSKA